MIPFLESGASLIATKGLDFLQQAAGKPKRPAPKPTRMDQGLDAALTAIAIAPQLVNLLGASPLMDRLHPLSLKTLYRLAKARPYLEVVSFAALGALTLRQRAGNSDPRWFNVASRAVATMHLGAPVLSSPAAFSPQDQAHLVVTHRELNRLLEPASMVAGIFLNGEARCYPLEILCKPHFVHDTVGGVPVAPTYCPLTHAAIALRDEWGGQRLELSVAAAPNNNVVFYEGRSDGMIQQLAAEIGAGPNAGDPIYIYPMMLTTWEVWKGLHPETTGIWIEQGVKGGVGKAIVKLLTTLDENQAAPVFPVAGGLDTRLPAKESVFGITIKGQSRAYTRAYLELHPVSNFDLGGEPIVVFYDAQRDIAAAYSRRWKDQGLTFQEARHGKEIAEDQEHGYLWNVAGCNLDGEWLQPIPYSIDKVDWYAWAHFHPETKIAGEASVRTTATRLRMDDKQGHRGEQRA